MGTEIRINDHSGEVTAQFNQQLYTALEAVGLHLEGEAKDELENDPRRIDTGRLRSSIRHETEQNDRETHTVIGTNVEYGIYVHEGTTKMAPNRYLTNALQKNQRQIERYVREHVE